MRPAGATPANLSFEPTHSSTFAARTQLLHSVTDTKSPRVRQTIVLCDSDSRRLEDHQKSLTERGREVVVCDPMTHYTYTSFEQLLLQAALVRFDCSNANADSIKRLLHICDHRQRHGMKPFLVCTAVDTNEHFKHHLHQVLKVDRTVDGDQRIGELQFNASC